MYFNPMTPQEFEFWKNRSLVEYAEDKMKANGYSAEEANEISEKSFRDLLPQGLATPDNFLFTMKNQAQQIVGYLWYAIKGHPNNKKAFIYDIVIEEAFRNQGNGRKAMQFFELEAKKHGLNEIGLHVFAFNETAIHLYKSLGYQVTDMVMAKSL